MIGGTSAAARNIISGNFGNGVNLLAGADNASVMGNYIGTDITGEHSSPTTLSNALDGVRIEAADVTIGGPTLTPGRGAGNVISGNLGSGIDITNGASGTRVQGNIIGLDATGESFVGDSESHGNPIGVTINNVSSNTIGGTTPEARNLISGNYRLDGSGIGVQILGASASGNVVEGNYIGTNRDGTMPLSNNVGVFINNVSGNAIGGPTPGASNLISGNSNPQGTGVGVYITGSGATSNVVQGNLIGTDRTGTRTLVPGQSNLGILVSDTPGGNIIGGSAPGAGNVISGFTTGIYIFATQSEFSSMGYAVIQGNKIGTDVSGTSPLGNAVGIYINGVPLNTIAYNVISDNNVAIYLLGSTVTGNQIQGNLIGLDATGEIPLGNYIGIFLDEASFNVIGGTTPEAGNFIAGNNPNGTEGSIGIYFFDGAANNTVVGNNIGTNVNGRSGGNLAMGDYGVLLYNASTNPIAKSLGNNRVVGSGIANLREFTGSVTGATSSGGGKTANSILASHSTPPRESGLARRNR